MEEGRGFLLLQTVSYLVMNVSKVLPLLLLLLQLEPHQGIGQRTPRWTASPLFPLEIPSLHHLLSPKIERCSNHQRRMTLDYCCCS